MDDFKRCYVPVSIAPFIREEFKNLSGSLYVEVCAFFALIDKEKVILSIPVLDDLSCIETDTTFTKTASAINVVLGIMEDVVDRLVELKVIGILASKYQYYSDKEWLSCCNDFLPSISRIFDIVLDCAASYRKLDSELEKKSESLRKVIINQSFSDLSFPCRSRKSIVQNIT